MFLPALKVEYLGHIIDADGLHPTKEKVKAIKVAPKPRMSLNYNRFWALLTIIANFCQTYLQNLLPYMTFYIRTIIGHGEMTKTRHFK